MALVVEDGTGLALADSYLSVEQADAYHAAMGNDAWEDLELEEKEVLLRRATRDLDALFGLSFSSSRLTSTQALLWPRVAYENALGIEVTGLPRDLISATAELALVEATTDIIGPLNLEGNVKSTTKKVGPLEKSVEYFTPAQVTSDAWRKVRLFMGPLLTAYGASHYATVLR